MNDIAKRIEQCCREIIQDYLELQKDPQVRLEERAAGMLRAAEVYNFDRDEGGRYIARYHNFCEDKQLDNPRDLFTELVEEKCKKFDLKTQTIHRIMGHITYDSARLIAERHKQETVIQTELYKGLHPMAGMVEPYYFTYLK